MKLNEIRDLSEIDKLDVVVQQEASNKWAIKLARENGDESIFNSTSKKEPRLFSTTDECLEICSSIGVKTFVIRW